MEEIAAQLLANLPLLLKLADLLLTFAMLLRLALDHLLHALLMALLILLKLADLLLAIAMLLRLALDRLLHALLTLWLLLDKFAELQLEVAILPSHALELMFFALLILRASPSVASARTRDLLVLIKDSTAIDLEAFTNAWLDLGLPFQLTCPVLVELNVLALLDANALTEEPSHLADFNMHQPI